MCIEYAFKRGGISIIRNFLHQAEGVTAGLPEGVAQRLKIHYKMRRYQDGKEISRKYVDNIIEAFPAKGDTK